MANENPSLFPLPNTAIIETVYVRLADGRIVARTPDELATLPAGKVPDLVASSGT